MEDFSGLSELRDVVEPRVDGQREESDAGCCWSGDTMAWARMDTALFGRCSCRRSPLEFSFVSSVMTRALSGTLPTLCIVSMVVLGLSDESRI